MKNHFEHFQAFIEEQKKWFEQHLSADFAQTWNDHIWVSGNQGSGLSSDFHFRKVILRQKLLLITKFSV